MFSSTYTYYVFHYFTIRPGVLNDGFLLSGLVFGCQGVPVFLSSITDSKARILDSQAKIPGFLNPNFLT